MQAKSVRECQFKIRESGVQAKSMRVLIRDQGESVQAKFVRGCGSFWVEMKFEKELSVEERGRKTKI